MERARLLRLLMIVSIACSLGAAGSEAIGAVRDRDETIQSGGVPRTYHLHVPPSVPSTAAMPLVMVFHGGGGTGAGAARSYGFNRVADDRGFAVVYPEGRDRRWNDGRGTTGQPWLNTVLVDDVGFVSSLIDHVSGTLRIDPHRVYATGISNGGIFAHRLGCELSGKIAAIAPVAGTIAEPEVTRCAPRSPVSIIEFHGTEDRFVPYGGGEILGHAERGRVLSVAETTELWAKFDGCPALRHRVDLPPRHADDGTRARQAAYGPCRGGSAVVLYTIVGGGHTWPGTAWLPLLGPVSRQIDATEVIWEFFEGHPKG
jgi:polyhydroxybutyrate depolymerase